jgi:hypothetical protein
LSVRAPVFIPTDEIDLDEQKDLDFEAKSCGFIGLSRVSIAKNSHGSRDASRDKKIDEVSVTSSKSYKASPTYDHE